ESSTFCQTPATVGSCAAAGRGVTTASAARPAMPSHVNGLFTAKSLDCSSRYQLDTPLASLRNMAISRSRGTRNGLGEPNVVPRVYAFASSFSVISGSLPTEHLCRVRHALRIRHHWP